MEHTTLAALAERSFTGIGDTVTEGHSFEFYTHVGIPYMRDGFDLSFPDWYVWSQPHRRWDLVWDPERSELELARRKLLDAG